MTRRIAIEPDRIRCSLQGFDVFAANLREMAYDSRFASIALAERGSLFLRNRTVVGGNYNSAAARTVLFSRDFGVPPIFEIGRMTFRRNLQVFVPSWTILASEESSHSQNIAAETYPVAQVSGDRFVVTNYTTFPSRYYSNPASGTTIKWMALV